ncbi:MAG: hypothetical protein AB1500_12645, partial [Bacillota bacterium]
DYQYELCFKCHSYYSYRTSPPTWPSRSPWLETDQAKEFSPNNPAYHLVAGESVYSNWRFDDFNGSGFYGKFTGTDRNGNPWAWDSRLYCTDCHGSDSASVHGPHGSGFTSILKGPWLYSETDEYSGTGGTSNNAGDHLCYLCHDQTFYDSDTEKGSAALRSRFYGSNGATAYKFNYHTAHSHLACAACHTAIPHGFSRRSLLVTTAEDVRYSIASVLVFRSFPDPGQWDCNSCDAGVH